MKKGKGDFEVKDERRPGFAIIDNIFIDEYGAALGAYAIAAYCILARFANKQGTNSWPSYRTVGQLMGASRRTAIYAIQKLVDHGLVRKEARASNGESTTNVYTLLTVTKMKGKPAHGSASGAPPSASGAPPSASGAPPSASGAPDQDTINKTPLTRHLDPNDDDALAFPFVKVDRRDVRSERADQATPAETDTATLLVLRGEVEMQLDVYTGPMWDDRAGWLDQRSFDELYATLLWCEVVGERMDQDPDAIRDPVGFIRCGVEQRKTPGLRPSQIERIDGRVAMILELAEKGLT